MRTVKGIGTLALIAGLLFLIAGCKCNCKMDEDHAAKTSQPKSEHPTEHPKGEHPKGEHPK